MKTLIQLIFFQFVAVSVAMAAGSPKVTPDIAREIKDYNRGVELMMEKQFEKAEKWFRKSIERRESFPEAHNNLAYTLRKQGKSHFEEAMGHYNRAIELKPGLPEPHMYRGVLHVQMGSTDMALKDHETLVSMGSPLAKELEYVIENGREKSPERFFGVSKKM